MKKFLVLLIIFLGTISVSKAADYFKDDLFKKLDTDFWEHLKTCQAYEASVEIKTVKDVETQEGVSCIFHERFNRTIKEEGDNCIVEYFSSATGSDLDGGCTLLKGGISCCGDGYAPGYCKFPKKILQEINKDNLKEYFDKYCGEV